jgi:hypothetical protein
MHPIRTCATIALAWALVLGPASAHETWAERVILIHYGEPGEALDAYEPGQISALSAIAADGTAVVVSATAVGGQAVAVVPAAGDPAAVFYRMQLSHYIIAGDTWTKASATDAAAAAKTWVGSYTVTSILAWHASLAQPRGRDIELVPLVDPQSVAVGADLPLRAFRAGKPIAGMEVHLGEGVPPAVSDAAGNLSVAVKAGHQVILGSIDAVNAGHTTGYLAVLSFNRR